MDSLDPHLHASTANLRSVWEKIRFVRGDLRDETLLAEIVQGQTDYLQLRGANLAPTIHPIPAARHDINCLGNLKLLEAVAC